MYAPFLTDVEGRVVSPDTVFGKDSDAAVVASVEHETGNEDIPVSEGPGLAADISYGPGTPLLGLDDLMGVPNWWSSIATRQMGTSPVLEDTSDLPVMVGVVVSGPDLSDPGLGVMLDRQDVLSKTVPGSGLFDFIGGGGEGGWGGGGSSRPV